MFLNNKKNLIVPTLFYENRFVTDFKKVLSITRSYQVLSITHGIYASLDEEYEVRGAFLDTSKAFDKVWHEGLIFKLEQIGISGNCYGS